MPLIVSVDSECNEIDISQDLLQGLNGQVKIYGKNNSVHIGAPEHAGHIDIELAGDNNHFRIERGLYVNHLALFGSHGTTLNCGEELRIIGDCRIKLPEPSAIEIGKGCMFADQVDIMTSDFHPIFDLVTGEQINPARDIIIGEHVWLGLRVTVLKGARIGAGSVIGANSLVSKEIEPNCIAAGNPARVVRRGVRWQIPF